MRYCGWARSALGQKRTLRIVKPMSALPPKADIRSPCNQVRFTPKSRTCVRKGPKRALGGGSSVALSAAIASSPALPDKARSFDLLRGLQSLGGARLGHPGCHHDSVIGIGTVRLIQFEIILRVRHFQCLHPLPTFRLGCSRADDDKGLVHV